MSRQFAIETTQPWRFSQTHLRYGNEEISKMSQIKLTIVRLVSLAVSIVRRLYDACTTLVRRLYDASDIRETAGEKASETLAGDSAGTRFNKI